MRQGLLPTVLLLPLLALAWARPCSESDIYPGYPLPQHHRLYGRPRPYPQVIGCTLFDLANTGLTRDEAYTLMRAVAYGEAGEFRNVSVLEGVHTVSFEAVSIGDMGATVLAEAFSPKVAMPYDVRLALGASDLTSAGSAALASAVSAPGGTIASLTLDWNLLGDEGATALGRAVAGNQRLRTLGLERCGIGDVGAEALARALGALAPDAPPGGGPAFDDAGLPIPLPPIPELRELRLEGNAIGPDGAASLARALRRNARLETLTLALNPIGPEGARALAHALRHNRALAVLDLADCAIGDAGAAALGAALRANTALRELRLQGNGIGPAGARALADALRINPAGLRSVNLRLNRLDAGAATYLMDALRHAKATPEAGPSLGALHLEHCHVLPGDGMEAPAPIDDALLGELAQLLTSGGGEAPVVAPPQTGGASQSAAPSAAAESTSDAIDVEQYRR